MSTSQEEAEDDIPRGVPWALVGVAGTKEWAAQNTHHHSGREDPQTFFLKDLWVKVSHEAQISSAYFSGIKGPVLHSDCVDKKKDINHSNKFSAGTEIFVFIFIKLMWENSKQRLSNSLVFKYTILEMSHIGFQRK